jgi:uncharacterized protein YbjT (DUF2867 family)
MILITGATGNVGRELADALTSTGAVFRALVRDPARAAALPAGTACVVGDLDAPETLGPAFAGAERLFLLTPGTGTAQCRHALAAARAAGVRHIVHLSAFTVLGDPMPAMGRWHHEREEIVRACGIPATFLRPGGFMTNALEWVPTIRSAGYVVDPTGPGRLAPIDPADIAAVAAHTLTTNGHEGEAYVLTGPEALTVAEQVQIIAAATGLAIKVREPGSPAEAIRSRYAREIPKALADAIAEAFELMRADTVGLCTDTVARLLGRKPATFADWCARHANAFTGASDR